ncbi:MAG TPA: hypothetical protein VK661_10800 [Planctomycetota bacterium]|jgi:hypothetical protein|nr:hypothetical protein [Planctomycetota bacterium]
MMRRTVVPFVLSAVLLGALDAAAQDQDPIKVELGIRGYTGDIQGRLRKGNAPSGFATNVDLDTDLDSTKNATGLGVSLTARLEGGHVVNIQGWQYLSQGKKTLDETLTFGSVNLPQGGSSSTDVDFRYVSAKYLFGITPDRDPLHVGLGIGVKEIHFKTDVSVSSGERESLNMRTVYADAEFEVSYRISEAILLIAEGGFGMPRDAKESLVIKYPAEVRAGARLYWRGVKLEVGYQVFDANLVENEHQVDEQRASINLSGVYFELAARF